MDLHGLLNMPRGEWPREAENLILMTLLNHQVAESERLVAAELAGDLTVMNDEIAEALLTLVADGEESAHLRGRAAISLGPVLEEADLNQFDDEEDVPISEQTFDRACEMLRKVYLDQSTPAPVRRRILEAAVRSPQLWQANAVADAYSSGDKEWMLTAVFCMRWVRGFEREILDALKSSDPLIHFEAVSAAGAWELDAAWPHIAALIGNPTTPKALLIAAIEAAGSIRPQEVQKLVAPFLASRDEAIVLAADEAIALAAAMSGEGEDEAVLEDDEEEEGGNKWVN